MASLSECWKAERKNSCGKSFERDGGGKRRGEGERNRCLGKKKGRRRLDCGLGVNQGNTQMYTVPPVREKG